MDGVMDFVKYYPYRKGYVTEVFMTIPSSFVSTLKEELHKQRAKAAGKPYGHYFQDNKECFIFLDVHAGEIAVEFTDGYAIFGKKVIDAAPDLG